jgi:hypothetical protein
MHGAEDMVVDHNMVVPQVFRRLGECLDRTCIAAEFDLRVNHTSFHRPLPFHDLSSCASYSPFASRLEQQPDHRHRTLVTTRSQITRRDDDRELQTEQTTSPAGSKALA